MSQAKTKTKSNWPSNNFIGHLYFDVRGHDPVAVFATSGVKKAVYQLEQGAQGTLHWQFYLVTSGAQKRPIHWFKKLKLLKGEWIESCRSAKACESYCSKNATRIKGPFTWKPEIKPDYKNSLLPPEKTLKQLIKLKLKEIGTWNEFLEL